jgi:hypothetical protein
MIFGTYIDVYGPNRHGEFVATLPDAHTQLITHWEDLEEIKARTGVTAAQGDVLNLMRRSRDPDRQIFPKPASARSIQI